MVNGERAAQKTRDDDPHWRNNKPTVGHGLVFAAGICVMLVEPSKHQKITQCWFTVGRPFVTLA